MLCSYIIQGRCWCELWKFITWVFAVISEVTRTVSDRIRNYHVTLCVSQKGLYNYFIYVPVRCWGETRIQLCDFIDVQWVDRIFIYLTVLISRTVSALFGQGAADNISKVNSSAQTCVVLSTAHSVPATFSLSPGIRYLNGCGPTRWTSTGGSETYLISQIRSV
jgi:hypothetical protein